MAYKNFNIGFARKAIAHLKMPNSEIAMLELGNQSWRCGQFGVAKDYFQSVGMLHVSIDTNGDDGTLDLDLCAPLDHPEVNREFDIITNMGTSEHVQNQYQCFKNIHTHCRKGGVVLNIVPRNDALYVHGIWNYYPDFFDELIDANKYKLIGTELLHWQPARPSNEKREATLKKDIWGVSFEKTEDNDFMSEEDFNVRLSKYLIFVDGDNE